MWSMEVVEMEIRCNWHVMSMRSWEFSPTSACLVEPVFSNVGRKRYSRIAMEATASLFHPNVLLPLGRLLHRASPKGLQGRAAAKKVHKRCNNVMAQSIGAPHARI